MVQRILSASLILNAVLLGLLVRPLGQIGTAEAQGQTVVNCVGFDAAEDRKAVVRLHNAGSAEASAELRWLDMGGQTSATFNEVITPGATLYAERTGEHMGAVARIVASSGNLVVDGEMLYEEQGDEVHRRTVTCAR